MIEKILTKLIDILAADSRLLLGGNAYTGPWPGYKREENGDTPTAGYINLYDKPYDEDGAGHRPGVYVGTKALEVTDSLDIDTQSAGARIEYRSLLVPLVVCVQAGTKNAARKQRNQLRHNIEVILMGNIVQDGYWYDLVRQGGTGGAFSERMVTTATGGGDQQVAEGIAIIPYQVRYSWKATCDA